MRGLAKSGSTRSLVGPSDPSNRAAKSMAKSNPSLKITSFDYIQTGAATEPLNSRGRLLKISQPGCQCRRLALRRKRCTSCLAMKNAEISDTFLFSMCSVCSSVAFSFRLLLQRYCVKSRKCLIAWFRGHDAMEAEIYKCDLIVSCRQKTHDCSMCGCQESVLPISRHNMVLRLSSSKECPCLR